MIKFFRKIRQKSLTENKTGKYFKYAFGEIVLVVIGILIALQINNWNSNRLVEINITNYYERIIVELDEETEKAMKAKAMLESLIDKSEHALRIIASKNTDSISVLKDVLGATATTWDVCFQFPITKEFIDQNYLSKIKNDTIKMNFELLAMLFDRSERLRDNNNTQYLNTIEPFFIKNINYSEVALPNYKEKMVQGGPTINYEDLFNNLELWNIITFKFEALMGESRMLSRSIKGFQVIKVYLEKEIEY